MESSYFRDIQAKATWKPAKWDENMDSAEEVVYSSFLVSPVREAGVDVDGLVRLPMVMSHCLKKDESVQVTLPCSESE